MQARADEIQKKLEAEGKQNAQLQTEINRLTNELSSKERSDRVFQDEKRQLNSTIARLKEETKFAEEKKTK